MAESEGGYCSSCAHLEAQVAQLQAQLAEARREIQHLRRQLDRLRRVIQFARANCQQAIQYAQGYLSQRSGVPRGQWAYAKGAYTVAARILAILNSG